MSSSEKRLLIIGCGPGSENLFTDAAHHAIREADRVLNTREISLAELMAELKRPEGDQTVVLVSGDSGFFSATKMIIRDFSDLYDIEVLPGIGSVSYLSALTKTAYDDALLISLHGRDGNVVPAVAYHKKVFALTGGDNSVRVICQTLCRFGLGSVQVSVGERLSFEDERFTVGTAEDLQSSDFDDLSVVLLENPLAVDPHLPLHDSDFLRGEVPMTKEEVRWLSIQKLGVSPQDTVFDIGAGTGSVSIELARRAFEGMVYAIEAKAEACALIRENRIRHGAFNSEVICGKAPDALDGLPVPDKAFIGGSSGAMDSIVEKLLSLNPDIKIVANAITLQTVQQILTGFEKQGLEITDTICVNIAASKKLGSYDLLMAQNPVYIITGMRKQKHA